VGVLESKGGSWKEGKSHRWGSVIAKLRFQSRFFTLVFGRLAERAKDMENYNRTEFTRLQKQ